MKILKQAERTGLLNIECRGPFFGVGVKRVLWRCRGSDHGTRVVERLSETVACLEPQPETGETILRGKLQRVVSGMRAVSNQSNRTITAGRMTRGIELRVWREFGVRARVPVGIIHDGQLFTGGADIGGVDGHASKVLLDSRGPGADVSILKVAH